MASRGFLHVSIPEDLAKHIDSFVASNRRFRSRAEVVVHAAWDFLERHGMEPQTNTPQEETQEGTEKGRGKGKH